MIFKRITGIFGALVLAVSIGTAALADSLAVGGEAVGIRISANGVIVAGTSAVETENGSVSPAEEAGIRKGDVIVKLGGVEVKSAEDFTAAVAALNGDEIKVTVDRDGKQKTLKLTPAKSTDGAYRLGLWLRDGISGVGTLTFYDPETGLYGALGHGISDGDTGRIVPLSDGSIFSAEIVGIKPGQRGKPGELCGESDVLYALGDIRINCGCGIFGVADFDKSEILETGEAKQGKATIRCTLSGSEVGEYEIEIVRVFEQNGHSCFQIAVTDEALLEATGGIVQGMSGSPVIQNGRLVGAVTHVFVNDPAAGYGISISDMTEAAQSCNEAA